MNAIGDENIWGAVRGVVWVENGEYRLEYVRKDVSSLYSREDYLRMFDEFRTTEMSSSHLEDIWRAGKHQGTIYLFDEAIVYHFLGSSHELAVSLDSDFEVSLQTFRKLCDSIIEARIRETGYG